MMGLRESIARTLSAQLKFRVAKLGKGKIGNEHTAKNVNPHDNFEEKGAMKLGGMSGMHLATEEGDPDEYNKFAKKNREFITNKKKHQSAKLKTEKHPGFKSVQSKIEREGYSSKIAGAILASRTRGASKASHKANPHLNRVKG
jgi:hypothetical protein